jgi:hypothetical protein
MKHDGDCFPPLLVQYLHNYNENNHCYKITAGPIIYTVKLTIFLNNLLCDPCSILLTLVNIESMLVLIAQTWKPIGEVPCSTWTREIVYAY